MPRVYIAAELRRLVRERALSNCEYCLINEDDTPFTHPIDHIVALQHGGLTVDENLALACMNCNRNKGPNLSSIDPITGELIRLFNPRVDSWNNHFKLQDALIIGTSSIGRATVMLLRFNDPMRILEREQLLNAGRYLG